MKYLYIINSYFDDVEYGGFINVIASGNKECCKILEKYCPNNPANCRIPEEVKKAKKFVLANSQEKSGVIADLIA